MNQSKDTGLESARKRFIVALVMLGLAVIYTIWPLDLIPDILVPAGYLDDIPLLISTAAFAGYSYRKIKKERNRDRV